MDRGQIIFLGFAGLIIFYQMIKGWRLGFVRQLVRFGALLAAYLTAFWGASATVPFLRPLLGYPDFVLTAIGGSALGLTVYLLLCGIGGVLFKRTAHQDLGVVWFFYGISGALLGAAFGLLLTLVAADGVRLLGTLAEPGSAKTKTQPMVTAGLVELKRSLESGMPGEVLKTIDPVPKKTYVIVGKIGRTVSNLEAAERFLNYPGARELAERPEIQALRSDPEILAAIRDGHYLELIKNRKIVAAANDPKTAALIKKFEFEKALDYALSKPK